ncbi:MAG: PD-(D/E)XK nuclease family protein [Polyangiaceae bacterium]
MSTDLPPTTSASQLTSYAMCPRKYYLGYVLEEEAEFRSTSLVLGSAVHGALGWFFSERLQGNRPDAADAERIVTADLLALTAGEHVRRKTATFASLDEEGRRLVRLYLQTNANLSVAAVEVPFQVDLVHPGTGAVVGRPLRGYFDLVLQDGTIVELKTSSKGWNEEGLARHLQVGAYTYAIDVGEGAWTGLLVHVLVKLVRAPRLETYRVDRTVAGLGWWIRAASEIEDAITAHHFPPSPSPLCLECEHARACARMAPRAARPLGRLDGGSVRDSRLPTLP